MTFIEDLKKPINYISIVLAILGIASGFFFYLNSKKNKAISYNITEPSSLIYDSKNSSSAIKVIEKDSIPIKDNVYILTGTIWNSGNLPITNEDVRQNLSLNLASSKKILDFKIIKQTDPSIAKFNLTSKDGKSLSLSWKYFDPGYGFKFQIIYSGYENSQFNLTGKILDIDEFQKKTDHVSLVYYIVVVIVGFFLGYSSFEITSRMKFNKEFILGKPVWPFWGLFFILGIILIIMILRVGNLHSSKIPF